MSDDERETHSETKDSGRSGRDTAVLAGQRRTARFAPTEEGGGQGLVADRLRARDRSTEAFVELPGETTPVPMDSPTDGKYRFGQVLGTGGMGVVTAAHDVELGRTVAMKTLHPEMQDLGDRVSALVFEARISGQLEHPHIVPVHELGALEDGRVYYTMKLTGKTSLHDRLTALRQGTAEYGLIGLLQLLRGICMAMEYAHSRGVIHRDLKPENILIGEYGEVQIMDWGIAKVISPGADKPALFAGRVEPDGLVVGTPHYMSPEQARGDNDCVGPPSDIYSIGLILYQMLTLHLPFDAVTADAQMEALLSEDPPAPSTRAPERDIPAELERICLMALARTPAERYQSARTLWDEIEGYIEGKKDADKLRSLAQAQVGRADEAAARFYLLRERMRRMVDALRGADLSSGHFDSRSQRKDQWQQKLDADHHRLVEARAFAKAVAGYHQALAYDADNTNARQSLAVLYRSQSQDAADRGDNATMILYGDLERTVLQGGPTELAVPLSVRSYPEGADIKLYALTGRERLRVQDAEKLGAAPLRAHLVKPGSYLISATLPGCRENRAPVIVRAGQPMDVLVTLRPWSADTPLFGHQDEFTAICNAFESCLASQSLAGVMVLGEAGAGKSQLMVRFDDYLDRLPEMVAFAHASCPRTLRRVPFGAASQIMRHRAGIGLLDVSEEIKDKLDALVLGAFSSRGAKRLSASEERRAMTISRVISSMPGLCGAQRRLPGEQGVAFTKDVFAAFSALFEQLTRQGPLLLKIRGADNIDRLTRDCLTFLARQLRDHPVFFLGTGTDDAANLRTRRPLTLSPLSRQSAEHQISVLLGGPIAPTVKTLIHRLSGGNPSLIADLTAQFKRQGWLRRGRRWELSDDEAIVDWLMNESPTGADVMMTMLTPLSDNARTAAAAAAVAGTRFFEEELCLRLPGDTEAALKELTSAEVLARLPVSGPHEKQEYAFRHEVIRDTLYDEMNPRERAHGHTAVAHWLAQDSPASLATLALQIEHLELAGREDLAAPLKAMITAEAERWERSDAPDWFQWPEDSNSGVF